MANRRSSWQNAKGKIVLNKEPKGSFSVGHKRRYKVDLKHLVVAWNCVYGQRSIRLMWFFSGRCINKKPRCGWNCALKLTVTHTVRLRFCFFFIFTQTLVQLVKRDMVTAVIYCYITTEFHYAKRDSLPFTPAGFPASSGKFFSGNTSLHSLRWAQEFTWIG